MKRNHSGIAGLLFALLVLAAMPFSAGSSACADAATAPGMRFGQALALEDFDHDGKLDRARLASSGLHRSIEIRPTRTGQTSWLHFETRNNAPGSLFSKDLDNDGNADLIWTDLLHTDAIIVWSGDGTGRFERINTAGFAPDFIPGNFAVIEPDANDHELASDDEANSPVALEANSHCTQPRAPAIGSRAHHQGVLPIGTTRRTTSRGPPAFFI